ncbi:MAG: hypothetical protein IJT08_01805 [Alphaproteobacteria bacterium]|nr:hypothetical protein [Alphaproteobacteria bacterium]
MFSNRMTRSKLSEYLEAPLDKALYNDISDADTRNRIAKDAIIETLRRGKEKRVIQSLSFECPPYLHGYVCDLYQSIQCFEAGDYIAACEYLEHVICFCSYYAILSVLETFFDGTDCVAGAKESIRMFSRKNQKKRSYYIENHLDSDLSHLKGEMANVPFYVGKIGYIEFAIRAIAREIEAANIADFKKTGKQVNPLYRIPFKSISEIRENVSLSNYSVITCPSEPQKMRYAAMTEYVLGHRPDLNETTGVLYEDLNLCVIENGTHHMSVAELRKDTFAHRLTVVTHEDYCDELETNGFQWKYISSNSHNQITKPCCDYRLALLFSLGQIKQDMLKNPTNYDQSQPLSMIDKAFAPFAKGKEDDLKKILALQNKVNEQQRIIDMLRNPTNYNQSQPLSMMNEAFSPYERGKEDDIKKILALQNKVSEQQHIIDKMADELIATKAELLRLQTEK